MLKKCRAYEFRRVEIVAVVVLARGVFVVRADRTQWSGWVLCSWVAVGCSVTSAELAVVVGTVPSRGLVGA